MNERHIAQYGNIKLERGFCVKCNTTAIVLKGVLQCCDTKLELAEDLPLYMVSPSSHKRKALKKAVKNHILEFQNNKCMYCGCKLKNATIHFDHVVPFVSSLITEGNMVATCAKCNLHKSDKVFESLLDIMIYMKALR